MSYGHAANLTGGVQQQSWRVCSNPQCGRKFKPQGLSDAIVFCVDCRRKMGLSDYQEALDRFREGMRP